MYRVAPFMEVALSETTPLTVSAIHPNVAVLPRRHLVPGALKILSDVVILGHEGLSLLYDSLPCRKQRRFAKPTKVSTDPLCSELCGRKPVT